MYLTKLKSLTASLVTAGVLCAAVGFLTFNILGQEQGPGKQKNAQPPGPKSNSGQGKEATQRARIVFWRGQRLASIRSDDSDSTWLSKAPSGTEDHFLSPYHLRVSPDGKLAACGMREVPQDVKQQIITYNYKTVVRKLDSADDQGEDLGVEALSWCWSRDSRQLVVGARHWPDPDEGPPETSHWIVDVKTKKKTELKLPAGHLVTDWSPDGKWFLTMSTNGPKSKPWIVLVRSDGLETRSVVRPEDLGKDQSTTFGRFSPDGRKALFIVCNLKENPQTQQVFATDLQAGKPRAVSRELNGSISGACWSPDGKHVAYVWRQSLEKQTLSQEVERFLVITDLEGKNARTVITEKATEQLGFGALDWR